MILSLMEEHASHEEVVKSGCHTLAILSDNRGEGGKIAGLGGVRVLLPVLLRHPRHVDLHRVAAVVLLRMLQEAPVAGDIARGGGVPLMLTVLREQADEVETVAAACHILYSITHEDATKSTAGGPVDIEGQLCGAAGGGAAAAAASGRAGAARRGVHEAQLVVAGTSRAAQRAGRRVSSAAAAAEAAAAAAAAAAADAPDGGCSAEIKALSHVLGRHMSRKDVARAVARSIVNLSRYSGVLVQLASAGVISPMLEAVVCHPHARDITESAVRMVSFPEAVASPSLPTSTP